jgi:hypothetical protein
MFGDSTYFACTRKYITYFAKLFTDINITREDANGTVTDSITVPIGYSPRDKMIARINADPNLTKEDAITLPCMSFEYHGYSYDGDRKLNTLNKAAFHDSANTSAFFKLYTPVPVDLSFSLNIYVKNAEDGTKIVEQIIPWFTPDWTANINLIPDVNFSLKIPILLKDSTVEDKYDGSFVNRRAIVWTLPFVLKGYLFKPMKEAPVIKFAETRYFVGAPSDNNAVVSTTNVSPGLLANGTPTSNAQASINPLLIDVNDDWTYAIQHSGMIIIE